MRRIVIIGNSGSGKSTLAGKLATEHALQALDLDTITWSSPGVRRDLSESRADLDTFIAEHDAWVIEGCYASLAEHALPHCTELVFLDPGVEACVAHNEARPWEPHKYASKEAQDQNLAMLQQWVRDYYTRDDEYSHAAHQRVFDAFTGSKRRVSLSPGRTATPAERP